MDENLIYEDQNGVTITTESISINDMIYTFDQIDSFEVRNDISVRGCCLGGVLAVIGVGLAFSGVVEGVKVSGVIQLIFGIVIGLIGTILLGTSKQDLLIIFSQIDNSEELEENAILFGSSTYIGRIADLLGNFVEERMPEI